MEDQDCNGLEGEIRDCVTGDGCNGIQEYTMGMWSECSVQNTVCDAGEKRQCIPVVGGEECALIVGQQECNLCKTGFGSCLPAEAVECCPNTVKQCVIDECSGTKICGQEGIYGLCIKDDPECRPEEMTQLAVNVLGSCTGQAIQVEVLAETEPAQGATVKVLKESKILQTRKTDAEGKTSFTLDEEGEYVFYATKQAFHLGSKRIMLNDCTPPRASFEENIETGQQQTIMLFSEDGNPIEDFNVILTYPDGTTATISTNNGAITFLVGEAGNYTATAQSGHQPIDISFEAKQPMQIAPDTDQSTKKVVESVFGTETAKTPSYLLIWVLAIAIISGLIITATKLKPMWFRIFMASTYTLLPLVVNYYGGIIWIAFAVIAVQTTILTALLFEQWKKRNAFKAMKEAVTMEALEKQE